ncbi:hypothetical protein EON65_21185 [archaeon]|nr:MAG: hypothetical protein EON65_21185 [archaeon]
MHIKPYISHILYTIHHTSCTFHHKYTSYITHHTPYTIPLAGLDYLSDLSLWRTHLSVEDALLRGRFFLRGSEVGWTKMWGVGGGAGGWLAK